MVVQADNIGVAICGAGVTGSHLVRMVARNPLVGRMYVVDFDTYETANLQAQDIGPQDVGIPKALAAARHARRLAGERLEAMGIVSDLARVPWGIYAGTQVVFGCLDRRSSRARLAEICWRLQVPFIDCGVNGDATLARVTVFLPTAEGPCYECGLGASTNDAVFACDGQRLAAPPTGAPAYLGAAAACLAMAAFTQLLTKTWDAHKSGWDLVLDLAHGRIIETALRRRSACPWDHQTWQIDTEISSILTIGQVLAAPAVARLGEPDGLQVAGLPFVRSLRCTRAACGGFVRGVLYAGGRPPRRQARCPHCHSVLEATSFDVEDALQLRTLSAVERNRSLRSVGVRSGDVLSVCGPGGESHLIVR